MKKFVNKKNIIIMIILFISIFFLFYCAFKIYNTHKELNKEQLNDNKDIDIMENEKINDLYTDNGINTDTTTNDDDSYNTTIEYDKYDFEFKNQCSNDAILYIHPKANKDILKKFDGYMTSKKIEIDGEEYYLLSKIYCTDGYLIYHAVLDSDLNIVYKSDEYNSDFNDYDGFDIFKSSKYIAIWYGNVIKLLDFNWKYQKQIKSNNIHNVVDDIYMVLEGNNYNLYDYDSNFLTTIYTKTENHDIFSPFGPRGHIGNFNGSKVFYINVYEGEEENFSSDDSFTIYFYDIKNKVVKSMKDDEFYKIIND